MAPGQKRYTVRKLQRLAATVVVARLCRWEELSVTLASEDLMRIVVDFCDFAGPVIRHLVEYASCFIPQRLCGFFLYEFMKEKKVKLYGPYVTKIIDLIVDFELFDSEVLRTVTELCIDRCSSYKRNELFSKFPNLQKLRIRRGITDETLKSIATHFPELTVLDASPDSTFTITDHGLQRLARLKKLRYVLLHPDYVERKCTNPTGSGLALLATSLPELVKLTFPGHLLRDALNSLHLTQSRLLTVKSLDFGESHIGIRIFIAISNVCPNLERLKIYVRGFKRCQDLEDGLHFRRLKELQIDEISTLWRAHAIYGFRSVWWQLSVLYLDRFGLKLDQMLTVSENCPNVRVLSFGGDCLDNSLSLEKCLGHTWPLLFPGLQILDFFSGGLRNLYYLMHKCSNLVKVAITGHDDEIDVLESLRPYHGFWPKVKIMSITILNSKDVEVYDENETLSHHLVDVFPSLKQIFVCINRDEEGIILTSTQGNDVALCSNVTFNLFTKEPELDYLDCFEIELMH